MAVTGSNPFVRNRVTQATEGGVDVPSIHEQGFKELLRRIETVRNEQTPVGMLLIGAAGIGKSHLLARLFRWANEEGRATVIYLHNVLASPDRLPRYLLHAAVSELTGHKASEYPQSALYALVNRAIGGVLRSQRRSGSPSLEARRRALELLGREMDPAQRVMPVITAFLEGAVGASGGAAVAERRARAAVDWLSGEFVERELALMLGLPTVGAEGAEIPDDAGVQSVFDVLGRLSGRDGRPFILCVDQVDNLDCDQVTALTAFLQALLDSGHNLCAIVSGVKDTMNKFRREGVISQACWDRLAQYKVELVKIGADEGRCIIEERVKRFMHPFRLLEQLKPLRERDGLFPLDRSWLDDCLKDVIEVRPRDIITWARDRWEEEQNRLNDLGENAWFEKRCNPSERPPRPPKPGPEPLPLAALIDEQVKKKVAEAACERKLHPDRLPPDADNLATLVAFLLQRCSGDKRYTLRELVRIKQKRGTPTYDIAALEEREDGHQIRNGLVFVTAESAQKSRWVLVRVAEDGSPPDHQLLVTDEERRPLKLGPAGRDLLDKLSSNGRFQHIKLTFEDYSGLDALAAVIHAARVGDLEVEYPHGKPRAVSEMVCVESLHRQGFFLNHPLLHELLTEQPIDSKPTPEGPGYINELRVREVIMAELSWRMGLTTRELTDIFIQREKLPVSCDVVWEQIKSVAAALHGDGLIHATAQDDDLFLLYKKAK
jgi:hypothetical protein